MGDSISEVQSLQEALAKGDEELAGVLAKNLAEKKYRLNIKAESSAKYIKVKFCLENRLHVEEFDAVLNPSITVGALKLLTFHNRGIPAYLQNWFIGHRIPSDDEKLIELGVSESSVLHCYFRKIDPQKTADVTNLYLTDSERQSAILSSTRSNTVEHAQSNTEHSAELEFEVTSEENSSLGSEHEMESIVSSLSRGSVKKTIGWSCNICTFRNGPLQKKCDMCDQGLRPPEYVASADYQVDKNIVATEEYMRRMQSSSLQRGNSQRGNSHSGNTHSGNSPSGNSPISAGHNLTINSQNYSEESGEDEADSKISTNLIKKRTHTDYLK